MRFATPVQAFLALAAAALAAAPASAFGIGLQPTTVEIEIEPGERQRQIVNIGNVHQEKTISLTIGLADWTLDDDGQIELSPPGEDAKSSADWVRFSPAFVTLEPGESAQVVVDMAAPTRLQRSGDFRFALIASTVLPEERAGQSGVWRKYQIASLFYLTTDPATSAPSVKDVGLTVAPDGAQEIDLLIENTGNAHARLEGEIVISGGNAAPVSVPVGNLVVLDEGRRSYKTPLPGDLPANPVVEVKLENIHSPQTPGGAEALEPTKGPLKITRAALDAAEPDASRTE